MAHAANTVTLAQLRKRKGPIDVRLGRSLRGEGAASGLLRAKFGFIPNKVDPEREGKACLRSSGEVSVVMPRSDSGNESFSGTYGARDEADLVLLFDGESMVLERLDAVLRGLHHLSGGVDVGQPAVVPESEPAPAKRRRTAARDTTSAAAATSDDPGPGSSQGAATKSPRAPQAQAPRPSSPDSGSSSASSSSSSSVSGMPSPNMPLHPAPTPVGRGPAPPLDAAPPGPTASASLPHGPAAPGGGQVTQYIPPSDSDSDGDGGSDGIHRAPGSHAQGAAVSSGEGGGDEADEAALWGVPPPGTSIGDVPFF